MNNACWSFRHVPVLDVIVATLLMLSCVNSIAQSRAEVQNVDFNMREDTLFVYYDLDNGKKSELFSISINVITIEGKVIHPQTTSGDIGNTIPGGKGKMIVWDIKSDNLFINEEISVEVVAEPMQVETRFVHRGTAVLLSAVVPGLGITKLNNGGPYWIMAIGFYGAAAGSYWYYSMAESNYTKYLDDTTEEGRNSLHKTVKDQNTISDVLMYTAGVIWFGNVIWTLVHPNKTKPRAKGMSFSGGYDPMAKTPVFTLKYKF